MTKLLVELNKYARAKRVKTNLELLDIRPVGRGWMACFIIFRHHPGTDL